MRADQAIRQVADDYEREGYTVLIGPTPDQLPAFAVGYQVDLLAKNVAESVLVKVRRNRWELADDPTFSQLADITLRQPGWRFDLVILGLESAERRMLSVATEPTVEDIEGMLFKAEQLLRESAPLPASLIAWAAFEASMRRVLREGYRAPSVLLRTAYGMGNVSKEDFALLDRAYKLRTQAVHGFVPANLDADLVTAIIRAARHLLSEEMKPEPVAG